MLKYSENPHVEGIQEFGSEDLSFTVCMTPQTLDNGAKWFREKTSSG